MCFIAVGGFSRNLTRNVYKRYQGLFMNFMFKEHFPWHSATKRQHSPMSKLTETAWIWIEQVVTVSLRNLKKKKWVILHRSSETNYPHSVQHFPFQNFLSKRKVTILIMPWFIMNRKKKSISYSSSTSSILDSGLENKNK